MWQFLGSRFLLKQAGVLSSQHISLLSWLEFDAFSMCCSWLGELKVIKPCQLGVWTEYFLPQCWKESKIPEISQHQVKPPFFWGAHGFSRKMLVCSRGSHGHHTWSPRTLPKLGCLFVVFMGTRGRKCIAKTLSGSDHLKLLDIWLDETWVRPWDTPTASCTCLLSRADPSYEFSFGHAGPSSKFLPC